MDARTERVARFLQVRDFEGDKENADRVWNEDYCDDDYKDAYRADARRLIEALRQFHRLNINTGEQ
jgi:hypothetical protein